MKTQNSPVKIESWRLKKKRTENGEDGFLSRGRPPKIETDKKGLFPKRVGHDALERKSLIEPLPKKDFTSLITSMKVENKGGAFIRQGVFARREGDRRGEKAS